MLLCNAGFVTSYMVLVSFNIINLITVQIVYALLIIIVNRKTTTILVQRNPRRLSNLVNIFLCKFNNFNYFKFRCALFSQFPYLVHCQHYASLQHFLLLWASTLCLWFSLKQCSAMEHHLLWVQASKQVTKRQIYPSSRFLIAYH